MPMDFKAFQSKHKLTTVQMAVFLGQCAHESIGFTRTEESLMYTASRLIAVFPKYFPDEKTALKYAKQPQKIANRVYANRMGNGDEKSGDGYRYRGRGYLQLTGKNNYAAFSTYIGEDCVANPSLVAKKYPLESALWYFKTNNIFNYAKDLSYATIFKITKLINGGSIGLLERIAQTQKYYNKLLA